MVTILFDNITLYKLTAVWYKMVIGSLQRIYLLYCQMNIDHVPTLYKISRDVTAI